MPEDEDDIKEILTRPTPFNPADFDELLEPHERAAMRRNVDAICDKHGVQTPERQAHTLERNGFANIITLVRDWQRLGTLKAVERIEEQAEIGLIFIDMHNEGRRPFWHEAIAEHKRRAEDAKTKQV